MNQEKHLRQSWGTPAKLEFDQLWPTKGERPHKGDWDGPTRDTAEKPGVCSATEVKGTLFLRWSTLLY